MDKQEAIKIITQCAKIYKNNLVGKSLLIVYFIRKTNKYDFFEIKFSESNFCHLTGVVKQNGLTSSAFYNLCIENKIKESDFEFKDDGTTYMKLSVLPKIIHIQKASQMSGNYNNSGIKLYTHRLAGGVNGCMGFINTGETYYSPNTVLKEDIRNITSEVHRVIATFTKSISDTLYNKITYCAKKVDLSILKTNEEIYSKLVTGLI